jgi:DNA-binding XRE family transcriptional regulator
MTDMQAAEFRNWRERLGQTQQQIAERLGVSRTTIQNWESTTPIPHSVEMSCKVWEHRIRQEDPGLGPLTLIYSDGPMFVDPYGPRRRPAMMQQEPHPTNAAVIARVQQLADSDNFYNPFVIASDHSPVWNAPELDRVIKGEDNGAPTLTNMLRKAAKDVRENSAYYVRSHRVPTPEEVKAHQNKINAQADILDAYAGGNLVSIVKNQTAIEQVFYKLVHELSTKAPDDLVSGVAFAFSVFDRFPINDKDDQIIEEGNDFILQYRGYEGRFPKIPMFPHKWTINLSSNDRRLFTKIGGNVVIDGRTREEAIANAKRYVDELGA